MAESYKASELHAVCELGRGGMGRVEVAVRRGAGSFERLYAVKRLHASHRSDPEFRSMFADEARIAGRIRHPNVVGVLDVGEDSKGPFLLMQYVDGLPLSRILRHHAQRDELLPVQLCATIGAQAADGLHAAHELEARDGRSMELVHRDLTPQNVLVGFDGLVRVTDFGVAMARGRDTRTETGVLKGKVGYMSPEQLRYESIDRRSDLFSLGVVLYELLTCQRLYSGGERNETARRILDAPPPDVHDVRRDVPDSLVALLFRLLAKDRAHRPVDAQEVSAVLRRVVRELREGEEPIELDEYMRRVFASAKAARRERIDAGLALLDEDSEPDARSSPRASWVPASESTAPTPSRPRTSARPLSSRTQTLIAESGSALVRRGNVVIQVRVGEMTTAVFEAMRRAVTSMVADGGRYGYMAVIEPEASLQGSKVRDRQRATIDEVLDRTDTRLAILIVGDGVSRKLSRSIARVLLPGRREIRVTADVKEACEWVGSYGEGVDATELEAVVEEARRKARASLDRG